MLSASGFSVEFNDYGKSSSIANDKPNAAYRWIDSIESVCGMLTANPEMGQVRNSRNHGPCRRFVSGNYVIFFRAASDGVEIIRFVRAERDLDNI